MPDKFSLARIEKPEIVIIGAGATGCFYGAHLSRAKCRVTMVARRPELAELIRERGITVEENKHAETYDGIGAVSSLVEAPRPDLVMLCVKAPDTAQAIRSVAPHLPPSATVLTLQNGLGNIEAISECIPKEQILAGVSYTGSTLLEPARVRIGGRGATVLGEPGNKISPRLLALLQLFGQAGLEVNLSENIMGVIWSKVLVNAGINPLAAITRLRNGELAAFPESRRLMSILVAEGAELAEHLGIKLEDENPVAHTLSVALQTGNNVASMLQDILQGRKTEIESINAMLVIKGQEAGLNLPLNRAMTLLIRLLEKSQSQIDKI